MVKNQIEARGVNDARVLEAMRSIPREEFVRGSTSTNPYGDYPLPIGHGQTISQPYIVALMTEELSLRGYEKVLEVGTGSGYQTAILAELAKEVYTIERVPYLLKRSREILTDLGYENITFTIGDGSKGWPEHAPYNGILVTAAAGRIPQPLKDQLADNGVLVIPIGDFRTYQVLHVIRRRGSLFETRESIGCRFVPLISDKPG
jgi:protein-L-isoaspartate(D-aspartate) O-methyltransferase